MVANQVQDLPPDIRKTYRRFERWRSSHTGRLPIPEPLWAAAAELAGVHGVFRIARALHLEYGKLKELAGAVGPATKKPADKTRQPFPEPRLAGTVRPRSAVRGRMPPGAGERGLAPEHSEGARHRECRGRVSLIKTASVSGFTRVECAA
jgi:hypothetical protein